MACDHYHRFAADVALMRQLGLKGYRFSVSWPRVLTQGRGAANPAGLDFYDRLVDALLAAGIEPNLTLYHWDLPQALELLGGWRNRDVAGWFADYASLMGKHLGDRVRLWATHNEPWCTAFFAHSQGGFAPGLKLPDKQVYQVVHHILLSHGKAVSALRAAAPKPPRVGIAWNLAPIVPEGPGDLEAARRAWEFENAWWLDPVFKGRYPRLGWEQRGSDVPEVLPGDLEQISQPLDWVGQNYYFPIRYQDDPSAGPAKARKIAVPPSAPQSDWGWEVRPDGLLTLLGEFTRRYGKMPTYITENGYCRFKESVGPDGRVHDTARLDYLRRHLKACRAALDGGADLRGYYAWSLLDNFEWSSGYKPQFGLVHVDRGTQARTPKDSALWYRDTIAQRGFSDRREDLQDLLAPGGILRP
jgi:beta-glucosidase